MNARASLRTALGSVVARSRLDPAALAVPLILVRALVVLVPLYVVFQAVSAPRKTWAQAVSIARSVRAASQAQISASSGSVKETAAAWSSLRRRG